MTLPSLSSIVVLVSGGGQQQGYPGAGGYADEYANAGGAKQQLLTLIRSVRTVMRSKIVLFVGPRTSLYFLVPLIAFNIVTIIFLILFG